MNAALLEQLGAHHQVLKEEAARVSPIRFYASNTSGQVDDEVGGCLGDESTASIPIHEIEIRASGYEDLARPMLASLGNHLPAKESRAPGYNEAGAINHVDHACWASRARR